MKVILKNSKLEFAKHTLMPVEKDIQAPEFIIGEEYKSSSMPVDNHGSATDTSLWTWSIAIANTETKQYNGLMVIRVKGGDVITVDVISAPISVVAAFATSLDNGTEVTPYMNYPFETGIHEFVCPSDGYFVWFGNLSTYFNFIRSIKQKTIE